MADVTFTDDIQPVFKQYFGQMVWRFDLTKYEDVKANAELIQFRISATDPGTRMPPPPFPALSSEFVAKFDQWIKDGYPQ